MNTDNLDILFIEKKLNLKSDELIVLGGRPGMGKTLFALSLMNNSPKKGCFLALCESSEEIAYKEEKMNIKSSQKNYVSICIELPSLIELMELIVAQKDKFDYFVIDDMGELNEDINPLFSKDKNYQFVLRHLKLLAKTLNKNIILISQIDEIIEVRYKENGYFPFSYYASREKFIDHILIIYRPTYYKIEVNEIGEVFEDNDGLLYFAKTKLKNSVEEVKLKFNRPVWSFPENELFEPDSESQLYEPDSETPLYETDYDLPY